MGDTNTAKLPSFSHKHTAVHTCIHTYVYIEARTCIGVCGAQQLDGTPKRAGIFEVNLAKLRNPRSRNRSNWNSLSECYRCMYVYVCKHVYYLCVFMHATDFNIRI